MMSLFQFKNNTFDPDAIACVVNLSRDKSNPNGQVKYGLLITYKYNPLTLGISYAHVTNEDEEMEICNQFIKLWGKAKRKWWQLW